MSTQRNSTTDKRQKSQYRLAFPEESRGAAPMAFVEGTESELAERRAESPATEQWMEEVCERENCKQALRRVKGNEGESRHRRDDRRETVWTPERALASHSGTTPQRNLQTATGTTSRNTEAGRWSAQVGHSDGAGSIHSASGDAGAAKELGRNVLRTQLWVSAQAIGTSGGGAGAAIPSRRLPLGGGSGSREIFRPGQPRPITSEDRRKGQR